MQTKLNPIDGKTLISLDLPPIRFVVDGLLPQGLSILAGAPKAGKSWLVLWLCLKISQGDPVWGFSTEQGSVLYLSLEDSDRRIQNRVLDLTEDASSNLYFSVTAGTLNDGLEEELEDFLSQHPDTSLIAIDTLQKVRPVSSDSNAYAGDYRDIGILKDLADRHSIAILLVHHLRKLGDSDPMNRVSGTTGITGAADTTFVLQKEERSGSTATLICTGRDIEDRELHLQFDRDTCRWELTSDNFRPEPPDRFITNLCDFMKIEEQFCGTATQLSESMEVLSGERVPANIVAKKLRKHRQELLRNGVFFQTKATHERKEITIWRECVDCVGCVDKTAISPMEKEPLQPSRLAETSGQRKEKSS